MSRKPAETREEAIDFLKSRNFIPPKGGYEISTSQLKRYAGGIRAAEKRGESIPSVKSLRGHDRAQVDYLKKEGHRLEQYHMDKPKDRELDAKDLDNAYKKAGKPAAMHVVISGVPKRGSPTDKDYNEGDHKNYTFEMRKQDMETWTEAGGNSIELFAYYVSGIEWHTVTGVSFVPFK